MSSCPCCQPDRSTSTTGWSVALWDGMGWTRGVYLGGQEHGCAASLVKEQRGAGEVKQWVKGQRGDTALFVHFTAFWAFLSALRFNCEKVIEAE